MKFSGLLSLCVFLFATGRLSAMTNVLFSTRFEASEGYSTNAALVGQNGWQGFNSGELDNGILNGFIAGEGQQAYLGFGRPPNTQQQVFAWHPINYQPASNTVVRFSVSQAINDSSNGGYDYFFWSVLNQAGKSLFSLVFDNYTTNIQLQLDDNSMISSGVSFAPNKVYRLQILMDFPRNLWSATLDNSLLATNQPITKTGAARDLGDIDAIWQIADSNLPGDNYLLFDNYAVTAETPELSGPFSLFVLSHPKPGDPLSLRLSGASGSTYVIEAAPDLSAWIPLTTNVAFNGGFDFVDTQTKSFSRRFYRARLVP
jgi:hypothetical protein